MMVEHLPVLAAAIPLAAGILAPAVGWIGRRAVRAWSFSALILTLLCSILILKRTLEHGVWRYSLGGWPAPWGIEYALDSFGAGAALLVSLFAVLTCVYSWNWKEPDSGIYQGLYLLCAAGFIGMASTGDLFNLYVFLEIASLASYALIAAGGPRAELAAFRYLIVGSVGASLWVLGLGYLYAFTGTLNMADLAVQMNNLAHPQAAVTGLAFIAAGMAVKMAVFPMHGWQPEAYAFAPAALMPFLSAVPAKISAYALYRVLAYTLPGEPASERILQMLGWAGILTMLAGSLLALREKNLRKMLAYSSVSQIGYILMGFSLGNTAGTAGAFLHMIHHAVMKSCLFMAVGKIQLRRNSCDIRELGALAQSMPFTAACFAVAALAMIGFPPSGAFFSKWYLLSGCLQAGFWPGAAVLALSSLLSAVYFFRVLEVFYASSEDVSTQKFKLEISGFPMAVLSLAIPALGLLNGIFFSGAAAALPGFLSPLPK